MCMGAWRARFRALFYASGPMGGHQRRSNKSRQALNPRANATSGCELFQTFRKPEGIHTAINTDPHRTLVCMAESMVIIARTVILPIVRVVMLITVAIVMMIAKKGNDNRDKGTPFFGKVQTLCNPYIPFKRTPNVGDPPKNEA